MLRSSPVVKNIIGLNIGIFLLQYLTNGTFYDVTRWLSLYDYRATYWGPWQYITHMFVHSGWQHLFFNMLPIFILGPYLEKVMGQRRFLTFYLSIGFFAGLATNLLHSYEINHIIESATTVKNNLNGENVFQFVKTVRPNFFNINPNAHETFLNYIDTPYDLELAQYVTKIIDEIANSVTNMPMMGASGAVFGVLMAAALYFPNMPLILFPIPIPIKLKWLVMFYAFTEFYAGVKPIPGDNVAHFAHLSGMLFALIYYLIWKRKGFKNHINY